MSDAPASASKRSAARAAVQRFQARDDDDDEVVQGGAKKRRRSSASAPLPPQADNGAPAPPPVAEQLADWQRIIAEATPMARARVALNCLRELDMEGWFHDPVDEELAPGYAECISEPMDFSTIGAKLSDGAYDGSMEDVFADMRLVFRNAVTCVRHRQTRMRARAPTRDAYTYARRHAVASRGVGGGHDPLRP